MNLKFQFWCAGLQFKSPLCLWKEIFQHLCYSSKQSSGCTMKESHFLQRKIVPISELCYVVVSLPSMEQVVNLLLGLIFRPISFWNFGESERIPSVLRIEFL